MRYLLKVGRSVTRHEAVDGFFYVGYPPRALDGGRPIPWQSFGASIAGMLCRDVTCDHSACGHYVCITHEGKCPITGALSQFIAPIETNWAERRLF